MAGRNKAALVMYWKSKQKERKPRPSFPFPPPKIRVKFMSFFCARQNTLTAVKTGIRYSGMVSHTKMARKTQ